MICSGNVLPGTASCATSIARLKSSVGVSLNVTFASVEVFAMPSVPIAWLSCARRPDTLRASVRVHKL